MPASKPGLNGAKPRVIKYERKRQALLGNQRAVKHGYYTAKAKEARWQRWKALLEADRVRSEAWARTIPPIDYDAICDELIRLRAEQEAEERIHAPKETSSNQAPRG
jgi:hypothetical protein